MKIPTTRLDLKEIGYDGYYVVIPRSVKEGFVYNLGKSAASSTNGTELSDAQQAIAAAEQGRDVNIKFLELVLEWNLDDDAGAVLPLVNSVKGPEKKGEIVAQVPVDIIRHLADSVTETARVKERVKDFS